MTHLLSACKNTTRLTISLAGISPEAALILGKKFSRLSYLELFYGDPDKLSYLSPLTRKVQKLKYNFIACCGTMDFLTYYSFFDCPLVTHLIIEELSYRVEPNFSDIIKKFPALKKFNYTAPKLYKPKAVHFVYDVENFVFKDIGFPIIDKPMSTFLRFQDDIPSKTPLLSSVQEVTHESQFNALLSIGIYKFSDFIPQFAYVDAIGIDTSLVQQEELPKLLLRLKDIRSLSFIFDFKSFSTDLCKETFKATTVFLEVHESEIPDVLLWLTSCFSNLEELGICLLNNMCDYYATNHTESKLTFKFWENLVENCSTFQKSTYPTTCLFIFKLNRNILIFQLPISAMLQPSFPPHLLMYLTAWINLMMMSNCRHYLLIRSAANLTC
ncbi:hypothetical protein DSO57_1035293 [Entomophthora muscae]|uniref:Uncharacterized protein n=1 Tax=Entomophthora muscae TaxID=34485 RepID=A0ACC2TY89_9FUNG|nr:hypothetical protein DSO57_1035293 [Entomophthora muscae]